MTNEIITTTEAGASLETLTFSANYLTEWRQYIDASPRTTDNYLKAVKQFVNYLQVNEIEGPKRADVLAYREYLKATRKPTTVQTYMTALKIFFKWTAQEGIYPNIADNIKGAKVDREHKRDALTSKQERDLLQSIDRSTLKGKRDYALIGLMLTTGLRTISIIRADVGDIRTVGDGSVLYYMGKGHEEKAIFVRLAWQVEDAIRDYLQARGKTDPKEPLFASAANRNNGGRMTAQSISRIVKESLIAIGLDSDKLTAHSLRHTAATLNRLNGGTLEETQMLLDHRSIDTTLIYDHSLERAASKSEQRLADIAFS